MTTNKLVITRNAQNVCGLDDIGRMTECGREYLTGGRVAFTGPRKSLELIVLELADRATEGAGGYDESRGDKAICARAVASASRQGF